MVGDCDGIVGTRGESDFIDGPPPLGNVRRVGVGLLAHNDHTRYRERRERAHISNDKHN